MKERRWFTVLNLHLAVVTVLAAAVLFLAVKAGLAFHAAGSADSASYQQEQIHYLQLRAQMTHLQALPQKVDESRDDGAHFYDSRISPNYSTIAQELGVNEVKDQVRLSNTRYTASPAIDGLTEVRIDASLSGDYTAMMHFINDIERDKNHVFFIIDGLTFTGQQGGLVNLRMRLSAYLQPGATDLPTAAGGQTASGETAQQPAQQEAP